MGNTFGYVTNYSQNSDGTYACTLVYNNPLSSTPISETVNLFGFRNDNNLVSPNNPSQIIIMSNDNKYIFFKLKDPVEPYLINNIMIYYITVSTIKQYNSNIPLAMNYFSLNIYRAPSSTTPANSPPTNQDIYNSYLAGLNPSDNLLKDDSNRSHWSDTGYLFLTMYNFQNSAGISISAPLNNKIPPNNIIPSNICVNVNTPSVIPIAVNIDCRNIPSGTSIITSNIFLKLDFFGCVSSAVSSFFYCMCCIGLILFITSRSRSRSNMRRNGGSNSTSFTMSDLSD
jgi:hypothetical protein